MKEKITNTTQWPETLTDKDKELIIRQCELQHATKPENIEGMAQAYTQAKELALDKEKLKNLHAEKTEELILQWATLIEERNAKGYRKVTVQFANMSQAVPTGNVPRAMSMYVEAFADGQLSPDELYEEFEKIHPFEDGNGRVGDLLWKIATTRTTGSWPEALPPDIFGVHGTDEHDA